MSESSLSLPAYREDTVASPHLRMPEPVLYTPASSRPSSIFPSIASTQSDENLDSLLDAEYDSSRPEDDRSVNMQNERRYRLLLNHGFQASRMFNFSRLFTPDN